MKEYIFFTTEGSTEAPNEAIVVDNCQVIGRANGNNEKEALRNLINDNAVMIRFIRIIKFINDVANILLR